MFDKSSKSKPAAQASPVALPKAELPVAAAPTADAPAKAPLDCPVDRCPLAINHAGPHGIA